MSTATIADSRKSAAVRLSAAVADIPDAGDFGQAIRQICWSGDTPEIRSRDLVHLLASQQDVVAAALFACCGTECRPTAPLMCWSELSKAARAWEAPLLNGAQLAASSSTVNILPLQGDAEEFVGILAPVVQGDTVLRVVCLVGRAWTEEQSRLSLMAQLVAAELAIAISTHRELSELREAPNQVDLVKTALTTSADHDIAACYHEVASQLREELDCHSVLLGVRTHLRRKCILWAISGAARFRRHSPLAICAEEVLNEVVLRDCNEFFDMTSPAPTATSAHKQLADHCQIRGIVSGPVRDRNERTIGAWAVLHEKKSDASCEEEWAERVHKDTADLSSRLALCIELLQNCRPRLLRRMLRGVLGPNVRPSRRVLVAVAVGLACLLALPLPFRVKCDCEVQAVRAIHPGPV